MNYMKSIKSGKHLQSIAEATIGRTRSAGLLGTLAISATLLAGLSAGGQTITPPGITIGAGSPVFSGGSQTNPVQICLPAGSTSDKVDVFLLFDDTVSFQDGVPTVTNIFSKLAGELEKAMPGVEFGFGVGRFEDYGGVGSTFTANGAIALDGGRPFILNQPIITAATAGGTNARNTLINAALSHIAPGGGADFPEASLEGLFQIATGAGFDGDGNGSSLDSGPAGALATQTNPSNSGDVPPYSSNVLPASGTLGGAGFRSGALPLIILVTDINPVAAFPAGQPLPSVITNQFGTSIPSTAFLGSTTLGLVSRDGFVSDAKSTSENTVINAVAPSGAATVQSTVNALNALGVRVLGIGPDAVPTISTDPSTAPSTWLSAIARLTGAVDSSGNPLVFSTSVTLSNLVDSIVDSISTTTTNAVDITLAAAPSLPAGLSFSFSPPVVTNVAPGQCASFKAVFTGAGATNGSFNLNFVTVGSGSGLGSIPVQVTPPTAISCPPNSTVSCVGEVPLPATNAVEFIAQGGSVLAGCGEGTTLVGWLGDVSNEGTGCPANPLIITRSYGVTNRCGDFAVCLQTITVSDAALPIITCPINLVTSSDLGETSRSNVTYLVTATDNCPGSVTVVCNPPSGSTFPLGITTVICVATDSCGNTASCTFSVDVHAPPPIGQCSRTYTMDADFAVGSLFNLNVTNVPDQLQINSGSLSTFPIMWIANAGEDSVSKVDTTTGRELARYRTWFGPAGQPGYYNHLGSPWSGAAPSRTAVDREGNCYVANRHFDDRPADVIKILATGGIDRNGNSTLETSADLDNNGVIDPGEILLMGDLNGNGQLDANEIGDERIAWAVSVGSAGALGRSLAIDIDGNIWLGLFSTQVYYKLSAVDGSILAGPIDVSPNTPYGALVDGNGILWGASLDGTLLKLDTRAPYAHTVYNHGFGSDYGIAIGNNRVYQANSSGNTYTEFDPVTETFSAPAASRFTALGIAVDGNGDIFVGNASSGGVTKFRPDGSVIWSSPAQAGTGEVRGCVVDSNNDVWLIHLNVNKISKYRGSDGAALGVFPTGDSPYTYTDATGIGRFNTTAPSGTWSVIHDSSSLGAIWGTASWNGSTPPGTAIKVEVRAADTEVGLAGQNYQQVFNSTSFCEAGIVGQLIQVRTTLSRPLADTNSPVLYDLTVSGCAGCVSDSTNLVKYSLITGTNVSVGQVFSYEISFDALALTNAAVALRLVDQLPIQEVFLDATTNGALSVVYDAATHTVVWDIGDWPALTAGPTNIVTVRVNTNAVPGSRVLNLATLLSSNLPPVITHDVPKNCPTCRPGVTVYSDCSLLIRASVVETNTLRVRQTGLFYQTVGVTNTCETDIAGCRLYLDGLGTNVTVHNASGVSNGVPYLQYHLPIPAHQGIEFTVEYYVPDRRTIPNPTFRGEGGAASAPPTPAGTLGGILRFKAYTNCAALVEFSTLSNRMYYVQYASDLGTNGVWKTAVPGVLGNGTAVQWLDSGPPKTESLPCAQPSRYYRVLLAP